MIGIDLFSGAGGMSLGAAQAGIRVEMAVETEPHAACTYSKNHPDTTVYCEDIRSLDIRKLKERVNRRSSVVLFGGPPCQGFSYSNPRGRSSTNRENWLFRECEPSFLSLGLADEAEMGTQPHQGTNVRTVKWLKSVLGTNYLDEFAFSAYDAEKTRDILRLQLEKVGEHNAIIAPMNTKISTLGAALLALNDTSVQLCYAQPNSYNYTRYSLPDEDYYMFRLRGFPH